MRIKILFGISLLGLIVSGCSDIHGPGIEFTAPRVTGRVVSGVDGSVVAGARVGRELYQWRGSHGEWRKGVEELRLLQTFGRSGRDGTFELPSERVALLVRFGEIPLNLRLTVQKGGFLTWQTNYFYSALATNSVREPRIEAGEIRLSPQ